MTVTRRGNPVNIRQWALDLPVTKVTGLWHLEGETVSILADGIVVDPQVVVNGEVTLEVAATRVHVGLPFTVRARSLPLTNAQAVIEGRRKRIVGLGVRVEKTKGLKGGRTRDELYPVERGGNPLVMKNGILHEMLSTNWEDDSSITFVQTDPLPVTMLSLVTEAEVGDEPD